MGDRVAPEHRIRNGFPLYYFAGYLAEGSAVKSFFTGWLWQFIIGALTILTFIGIQMDINVGFLGNMTTSHIAQYALLGLAVVLFIVGLLVKKGGKPDINRMVLKDIAKGKTDKEIALWNYGKNGYSGVPVEDKWNQWIRYDGGKKGLVSVVKRPDLDYYNFGEEFVFFDLLTGKKINIPTGNRARNERVGDSFRNGMVLRLIPMELSKSG